MRDALTKNEYLTSQAKKKARHTFESVLKLVEKPYRLRNFDPKIASRRRFKESFMRTGKVLALVSLAALAAKEMSTLINSPKMPDTAEQLSKQISSEIEHIPPNKNFTYNFTFIDPFLENEKSDFNTAVKQSSHFFNHSSDPLPTYGEDRYARANANLAELNNELQNYLKITESSNNPDVLDLSKLTNDEQKEKFIKTFLAIKIESQVKIIYDKNSSVEAITQAQGEYSKYISLWYKDSIRNILKDSEGAFDALSHIPSPAAPAAAIAKPGVVGALAVIDKQIAAQLSRQADSIVAKEIEKSIAKVNYEYLRKIGAQIDQGVYNASTKKVLSTVIADIPSTMQYFKNNMRLLEGNVKMGFAHIVDGHYAPQVIKENGVVKEFTGVTKANNKPGTKTYFPKGMNSEDVVSVMEKALTVKDPKVKFMENKITGQVDRVIIESEFQQEVSGIKTVTTVGYFNETTNTIDIISFYPTTGSAVRGVYLKK